MAAGLRGYLPSVLLGFVRRSSAVAAAPASSAYDRTVIYVGVFTPQMDPVFCAHRCVCEKARHDPDLDRMGAVHPCNRPAGNSHKYASIFALALVFIGRPCSWGQLVDNQVVGVRSIEKHGYAALQVGAINHNKPWKVRLMIIIAV